RTVEGFIPLDTPRGLLVRGGPPRWNALIHESIRRGEKFFLLWPELLALPRANFADRAAALIDEAAHDPERHDPGVLAALKEKPPTSMHEVADVYGRLITQALQSPETSLLAKLLDDPTTPLQFTREEVRQDFSRLVT